MQNNFIAVNKEKDGEILQVILEFKRTALCVKRVS